MRGLVPLLLKHVRDAHCTIRCFLVVRECSHHALTSCVSERSSVSLPLLSHTTTLIRSPILLLSVLLKLLFILIIEAVVILRGVVIVFLLRANLRFHKFTFNFAQC